MYVYVRSEPGLWTVGFYDPKGKWHPDSDHNDRAEAADRVMALNGSGTPQVVNDLYRSLLAIVDNFTKSESSFPNVPTYTEEDEETGAPGYWSPASSSVDSEYIAAGLNTIKEYERIYKPHK